MTPGIHALWLAALVCMMLGCGGTSFTADAGDAAGDASPADEKSSRPGDEQLDAGEVLDAGDPSLDAKNVDAQPDAHVLEGDVDAGDRDASRLTLDDAGDVDVDAGDAGDAGACIVVTSDVCAVPGFPYPQPRTSIHSPFACCSSPQ